jgi:hypothetical protein
VDKVPLSTLALIGVVNLILWLHYIWESGSQYLSDRRRVKFLPVPEIKLWPFRL